VSRAREMLHGSGGVGQEECDGGFRPFVASSLRSGLARKQTLVHRLHRVGGLRGKWMRRAVITLAVLLAACGSQAQAPDQPKKLNPSGAYVHRATGFTFPVALGKFTRTAITEYNQEKTDVSAGYGKVAGQESVAITVYVYPAPPLTSIGSPQTVIDDARQHLCTQVWEGLKVEIAQAHPDAELLSLEQIDSPFSSFRKPGHRAVFRFTGNLGGKEQPVRSEADLFCYAGGQWLVAYRTTAPDAFDYRGDLDALMHLLRWPNSLVG